MWEYVCPECGSSLDPGERCECEGDNPSVSCADSSLYTREPDKEREDVKSV